MHNGRGGRAQFGRFACTMRAVWLLSRRRRIQKSTTYTYDNLNRLSTVSEDGVLQATYTYDTNGNRATLTYTNGVVESNQYNKANWITGLTNKTGALRSARKQLEIS